MTIRNLTPRRTYYLAPCLSSRQARKNTVRAKTRCASVVSFSTGVNWKAPDVQFAGILAPRACRNGNTPIRLKLKNAGLGPVTKPFDVWFSWRQTSGPSTRRFQTRRFTIRGGMRPGRVITKFIQITGRGDGRYLANIRIDPQARLVALGEAAANNQRTGIPFQINTSCLGNGNAGKYDLAVSNIRFANNRLCKGKIRYVLSNRLRTRAPQLRFNVNIKIWVNGLQRANQTVWYRNLLRGRRAVTLNYLPTVIPTNRTSRVRIRVTYLRGAASRDINPGNDVAERTFNCDPTRL